MTHKLRVLVALAECNGVNEHDPIGSAGGTVWEGVALVVVCYWGFEVLKRLA